jgi:pyruvate dehydrogenase E1 component beta subunit
MDAVVNQAAKWSHMVGGQAHPAVTIRAIVNRGGEQGAQHSQALHAWFAHIPGLRVVMPASVADARDLLIASVLCDDPVMFIDDRWLYDLKDDLPPVRVRSLADEGPRCVAAGTDVTLVAASYSTRLAIDARTLLAAKGISAEVIDLRVINPFVATNLVESVRKTGRLVAIDGGWSTCGLSAEVLARCVEALPPRVLKAAPLRITLPDAPAPSSRVLEKIYYPSSERVAEQVLKVCTSP